MENQREPWRSPPSLLLHLAWLLWRIASNSLFLGEWPTNLVANSKCAIRCQSLRWWLFRRGCYIVQDYWKVRLVVIMGRQNFLVPYHRFRAIEVTDLFIGSNEFEGVDFRAIFRSLLSTIVRTCNSDLHRKRWNDRCTITLLIAIPKLTSTVERIQNHTN